MNVPKRRSTVRRVIVAAALGGALAVVIAEWNWNPARAAEGGGDAPKWEAPARAARKKNPIAADEKSLALGKAVYVKECSSCHADTGKGNGSAAKDLNPKPNDLTVAKVWEQTDGVLFWKITEGRKPMPGYEKLLSEDDRWHVINYMRGTFAPKDSKATTQPK